MSSVIRDKGTASVNSLIASAIREANLAANALRSRPSNFKPVYRRIGSDGGFLGPEMSMIEVEPGLLRSSKNIKNIIHTLKVIQKRFL